MKAAGAVLGLVLAVAGCVSEGTKTGGGPAQREVKAVESPNGKLVASIGFNVAKGIGVEDGKSYYKFGMTLPKARENNPDFGWADGWEGGADWVKIEKDGAYEGDGYGQITAESYLYFVRALKGELKGKVTIEVAMRGEKVMDIGSRPGRGQEDCGPMWGALNGHFWALDGHGNGDKDERLRKQSDFEIVPGKWYLITLSIDTEAKKYWMEIDGKKMNDGKPLGFRSNCDAITCIDFISSHPVGIDAMQVWVK